MEPRAYDAWYRTPRGAWIGNVEFQLLQRLLQPEAGNSLLDVGSGSGYFSRRFAEVGLAVTGIDPDAAMLDYARGRDGSVNYVRGTATALPVGDSTFDYVSAVTSLCFVAEAELALNEMWRVARRAVVLGLLNRCSVLHAQKHGRGSYAGARWDSVAEVQAWTQRLQPTPRVTVRSAVFVPGGGAGARLIESVLPNAFQWGGFLALCLRKP